MQDNLKYMKMALKEAKKAYNKSEVPIGCVIVKDNKIISKAYNKKEKTNRISDHAEILAINKACKKLKTWRLYDCILYTTVEPCLMCMGAIIQSKIKKIYFATNNEKFGEVTKIDYIKKNIEFNSGLCSNESKKLLQDFFEEKRK